MDSFAMTNVSILVQNIDDRAMLGMNTFTSSDNMGISDLMVVYTLDIKVNSSYLNNKDISAK